LIKLGITKISAGSKTSPGGYSNKQNKSSQQFEIDDKRSPSQIADMLKQADYNPVWKNWDSNFKV
jgi:2-iminoacetate synthase